MLSTALPPITLEVGPLLPETTLTDSLRRLELGKITTLLKSSCSAYREAEVLTCY